MIEPVSNGFSTNRMAMSWQSARTNDIAMAQETATPIASGGWQSMPNPAFKWTGQQPRCWLPSARRASARRSTRAFCPNRNRYALIKVGGHPMNSNTPVSLLIDQEASEEQFAAFRDDLRRDQLEVTIVRRPPEGPFAALDWLIRNRHNPIHRETLLRDHPKEDGGGSLRHFEERNG